ncbi:MAG: GNAT family N-acetyltransferase [Bacteriovorax sp.]|nr:GNAT family N-acetyltransferase [Bacteriovorax sp.]
MKTPIFRLATLNDIPQLVELRIQMQKEVNGLAHSKIGLEFYKTAADYFQKSLNDGSYISAVAELNDQIISANGIVFYNKPPSLPNGSGLVGYLTNVYTIPIFRGNGFATHLIDLLTTKARQLKADKIHLGTTELGKGIYERSGFKPVCFTALELKL